MKLLVPVLSDQILRNIVYNMCQHQTVEKYQQKVEHSDKLNEARVMS